MQYLVLGQNSVEALKGRQTSCSIKNSCVCVKGSHSASMMNGEKSGALLQSGHTHAPSQPPTCYQNANFVLSARDNRAFGMKNEPRALTPRQSKIFEGLMKKVLIIFGTDGDTYLQIFCVGLVGRGCNGWCYGMRIYKMVVCT